MRLIGAYRAIALSIVLAGTTLASTAPSFAEQVGTFPINPAQITTEGTYFTDNDPGDFTLHDASTNMSWKFRSADATFYQLLTDLNRVSAGNITQLAYVGNPLGEGGSVAHGSWVAPLSAGNQPSQYPGARLPDGAIAFNVQALTVQKSPSTQGFVLTDGTVTVAETPRYEDSSSLDLLKQMLQANGLNVVSHQSGTAVTPVADHGPVSVFLKIDGTSTASGRTCTSRWSSVKCLLGG